MDRLQNRDKRRSVRSHADFSALVRLDLSEQETHYKAARVLDISTTGLRIALRGDMEMAERRVIGVVIELPDGPAFFECRVRRISEEEGRFELGAVMAESDPFSRQVLYDFLTGRRQARAA